MLRLIVPAVESWDDKTEEFVVVAKEQELQLEHSLISLSKWESKWQKPFLTKDTKTDEEVIDYIRCMTISQNIKDDVYDRLSRSNIETVHKYIDDPMTATTFYENGSKGGSGAKETITSELIYYWMITLNIPMECQKWHLNRLLTLVRICNIKNAPAKKTSKRDLMSRYAALNAARRNKMNSTG